ncbi:MAG: amidohydrolase [Clostridiales bacterium]|nr:amidohydrolase [Clostridiales bacterium]MDY5702130.1 amidohydrolase [Eubacteriales bacterium]
MKVLKHGKIIPIVGDEFTGDIAFEDGKIVALGANLEHPDAEYINVDGCVVTPGFIDAHCHIGMFEDGMGFEGDDGNEYSNPVTPELRAIDAINPFDRCFEEACRGGVTSVVTGPGSANVIGGQFVAMKTAGSRVEDMIIREPIAMKAAFGENPKRVYTDSKTFYTRMTVASTLRKTLLDTLEYDRKLTAAKNNAEKKPDYDFKLASMLPVIRRELPLKIHAHRADDILTAIRIAKEFNIRITLDHFTEGYLIIDRIKEDLKQLDAGIIIGPLLSDRSKIELRNLSMAAPRILYENGIKFAMMTDHPVIPEQYLPVCAALAVREGLPEKAALESITLNAAEIVGIADRVGSLEVGKDADIAVFCGDPLDARTKCVMTIVNGKTVHDNL